MANENEDLKVVCEVNPNEYLIVAPDVKTKVAPLKDFVRDYLPDFEGKRLIFTAKKDLNFLKSVKEKYLGFELIVGVIFGDEQLSSLKEAEFVDFVITFKDPQEIKSEVKKIKLVLVLD